MKRKIQNILVYSSWTLFLITLVGCITWPGIDNKKPKTRKPAPPVEPRALGCFCSAQALGTHLASELFWTNQATGSSAHGTNINIPESGGTLTVVADPMIQCATNEPDFAFVTWKYKTNDTVGIFLILGKNCDTMVYTVVRDCTSNIFQVNKVIGLLCGSNSQATPFRK